MARRRMSPQDSFWLELDRPHNLLIITSLVWTTEPVDPDRLRQVIRDRVVDRYPVYTQRPVLHDGLIRTGRKWVAVTGRKGLQELVRETAVN